MVSVETSLGELYTSDLLLCQSSNNYPLQCYSGYLLPYLFDYKRGFPRSTNNLINSMHFAIIQVLPFLKNPKDMDLSYKMDLDFWDCFGREKNSVL